jgi:hypothetical protein
MTLSISNMTLPDSKRTTYIVVSIFGCIFYTVPSFFLAAGLIQHISNKWQRIKRDGCLGILCIIGCGIISLLWPLVLLFFILYFTPCLIQELWSFCWKSCTEEGRSCCFINCSDIEAGYLCLQRKRQQLGGPVTEQENEIQPGSRLNGLQRKYRSYGNPVCLIGTTVGVAPSTDITDVQPISEPPAAYTVETGKGERERGGG